MKLYYSINSPYARKCRIVVLEKSMQQQVEFVDRMPLDTPIPADLLAANPLGRVPALLLDDGTAYTESALICEYLDSLQEPYLFPQDASERFAMRRFLALTDGILDAAVHCVLESRKAEARRSPDWVQRKEDSIMRTLHQLEQQLPAQDVSMASIGFAVMLAYLDFRLPHLNWRQPHAAFATWYEAFSQRPSMQQTLPSA